jgi:glycine dehydrogenase subunit 1
MGYASFEELAAQVPAEQRLREDLALPEPLAEAELVRLFEELARRNADFPAMPSFLGAGLYDHFRPAVVSQLLRRPEFLTAYTPYQAEVSQGTLAAIFEFQTTICELTGLEVANASLYDGASACAEALWMAHQATRRRRILVSEGLHPFWRQVVTTYLRRPGLELEDLPLREGVLDPEALEQRMGSDVAAVLVQHPNAFGLLEPVRDVARAVQGSGAHLVAAVDPVSLGILEPPGAWGATTAVGEGQSLATPPTYGGPLLGFLATRRAYVRRLPGRLVAEARDAQGRRGFVLTLQAREQHIRRARATSNICTNNNLVALAMLMTLALLGPRGLREMAERTQRKAWRARERLAQVPGVRVVYPRPFFREFVLALDRPAAEVVEWIQRERGLLAGVPGDRLWPEHPEWLLVAVTEKRTLEEIEALARALEEALR